MNMNVGGLTGLRGAALFEKLSHGSTIPAGIKDRVTKGKALKTDLDKGKEIFTQWLITSRSVTTSAKILEQQVLCHGTQPIGHELSQSGEAGTNMIETGIKSIDRKLATIAKLKSRCQTLDNLGHNRNRFARKKEELRAKLEKKNRPVQGSPEFAKLSHDYDKAYWDFVELEEEIAAEYDFLIQESGFLNGGAGSICAVELKLLSGWIGRTFRVQECNQDDVEKNNKQFLIDMEAYIKDFCARQESYVRRSKIRGVQNRLKEAGLVQGGSDLEIDESAQPSLAFAPTDSMSSPRSSNCSDSRTIPSRSSSGGAQSVGSSKSVHSTSSSSTLGSFASNSVNLQAATPPRMSTLSDNGLPPLPARTSNLRSSSLASSPLAAKTPNPAAQVPKCEPQEYPEEERKESQEIPSDIDVEGTVLDASKFEELQKSGFLIAEKEQVLENGFVLKWAEYVGRDTGDSYWLEATMKSACMVDPPAIFA